ncbi:hypothetical protein NHX12_006783 [Muraenolepis orangiensis]|uniref:Uncharacterized protein n=1 Tax=Muraenolepis orangiensis TaxID=630683 RepID=A0A9Q0DNN5_9TELE|nr:hypothetical protein NHX12_006783 [Muraenolepis orangiensis]
MSSNRSFDSTHGLPGLADQTDGHTGLASHTNGPAHPHMVNNSMYISDVTNGTYSYMDQEEDEELERSLSPSLPLGLSYPSPLPLDPPPRHYQHLKVSKSMDLGTSPTQSPQHPVADESNTHPLF